MEASSRLFGRAAATSRLRRTILIGLFMLANMQLVKCTGLNEMADFTTMPTPPSFKHEPNPHVLYFIVKLEGKTEDEGNLMAGMKERRLICEADGYPEPKCHWKKNGVVLDLEESNGRITQQQGFGTIAISNLQKSDEGRYQCFCQNSNGTAYDREIELKQTYLDFFPEQKQEIVEVEIGKPFQRACSTPRSVPKARVYWIYKGAGEKNELTSFSSINSTHIAMDEKGVLYLQYARGEDQDNPPDKYFTCTAENMELKDYKFGDQFRIKVIKKPGENFPAYIAPAEQFVSPKDVTALKGETLELFCIFSGYPDQFPQWRKTVGMIDWNRVTFGTNFKKSFRIDNVGFEDEGTYECSFETDVSGTRTRRFNVQVDAAPYWVASAPHSVNSSETETVEFNCDAAGRPQPEFVFYKNGVEMTADNYHTFIEGSKLRIVNLKKGEDGTGDNAVYQCKASNKYGFLWANFYLNLLSFRPLLLEGPGEVTAVVGQQKKMACKFFGSPRPSVIWNAPPLMGQRGQQLVDHQGYSSWHLYDIKKEHEGAYECYAENKEGNATGRGYLSVKEATKLLAFPVDNTTVAGKSIRLPCLAQADESLKPTVTWLLYGQKIDVANSRYIVEQDNTLRIDGSVGSDTGEYTCVAETDYDRVNASAKIIVRDVPQPPQNVFVKCDNSTLTSEVLFQYFEKSPETPAREFWLQYNMDENEPNYWETYTTAVYHLANNFGTFRPSLHPWGNFAFRVVARNDVGDSAPTMGDRRCATPAARPSRNPGKVLVRGNTPDDVTVYWEPMPRREWNGPDFQYAVLYRPSNKEDEEFTEKVITDPEQNHVVLPSDRPYQSYDVQVKARNREGDAVSIPLTTRGYSGEQKPSLPVTGFDVEPREDDKPTVGKFRWNAYNRSSFEGELKGYKIEHWYTSDRAKRSTESERKIAYFDSAATAGTIYDLKPFAENFARIYAYSGGGDGPPSETRSFRMPEGFATPVQDLEVFALSDDEVGVLWKRPNEMNGEFKGYNVTWCPVSTTDQQYRIDFGKCKKSDYVNQTQHFRIDDLEPETDYRVEVTGVTRAGSGEPNSADIRTLPADLPVGVAPEKPSAHDSGIGDDHFNVTWLPGKYNPDDKKPLGNDHYVEYRPKGEEGWTKVPHQDRNFTVNVIGLQPGTTYEVRTVSVVDGAGGVPLETKSDIIDIQTSGEAPTTTTAGWLIAIIVAIIILIIILIIVCLVVRNRGAKYPVSEKEKEQGREPMLKDERGFNEYAKQEPDEEKRSLTGESKVGSETDSMAEYGDGETGRFTEDGSFIGQYGAPNKVITAPGDRGRTNLSTFV